VNDTPPYDPARTAGHGFIRTVLGDRLQISPGYVYAHEHLIIDSPLIADRFPAIHLESVATATEEVRSCASAGVALMIDAMPCSAGRDASRLAQIASQTGVEIVAATGLHHDRYYGPSHWSNNVRAAELADLFVADLTVGVDRFDYTGPLVRRTRHRAGVLKVATSGPVLDDRDRRNLDAVGEASVRTGAPILTHCEGGKGGAEQVGRLAALGIPPSSIVLSHVDKTTDLRYLEDLMDTGAVLELDQIVKNFRKGTESPTVQMITKLVADGYGRQIVVGTDGARRSLWTALDGEPGLAWLGGNLPRLLSQTGLPPPDIANVMRDNALHAFGWRQPAQGHEDILL
jgi:5-phospho-D-xylono-1,4-lactonase